MFPLETTPAQFWTPRNSGLTKIEDVVGKRFNLSRPGSGVDLFGKAMLKATGLAPSQITNVGHGQANQMMQDGVLDMAADPWIAAPSGDCRDHFAARLPGIRHGPRGFGEEDH